MKIHIPNSAFLGNIDPFIRSFDPGDTEKLNITANKKWISVHPVVLSMVAALGLTVPPDRVSCEKLEARSAHGSRSGVRSLPFAGFASRPVYVYESPITNQIG